MSDRGASLKARREAAGLTLAELAEKLGTTATQLSRLENGKRQVSFKWLDRYDAALPPGADDGDRRQLVALMRGRLDRHKLTVTGWSAAAGIPESTLRNFLSGRPATVTHDTLASLASALEIGVPELLGGQGAGEAAQPETMTRHEGFGPGTFGRHEAFHMASVLAEAVDERLSNHPAVLADPLFRHLADSARDTLLKLYAELGRLHP